MVHSRARLQSKIYSTYRTEDNRGSLLVKDLVQSFCGIWSGNKSLKKFNEAHRLFSEQTITSHDIQTLLYRCPLSSESSLLLTVWFVPGERKPLYFPLIQPARYRQPVNINTLYGPLKNQHIKKFWLHHIFMNSSEQPFRNNLVDMIIIKKHPPLDSTVTSLYSGHL